MKKLVLVAFLTHATAFAAQALVTVGDDSLYAGYLRGGSFVGANHKAQIKSIAISLDKFSKKNVEDLYECEFKSFDGNNVAFMVRFDGEVIKDASCAEAPAKDFRKAWSLLIKMSGL